MERKMTTDTAHRQASRPIPHSSHWGAFSATPTPQGLRVEPHPGDPDPSPILRNIPDAPMHRSRITQPMVRRGWLEDGPGPDDRRGRDSFVPLSWPEALDLAAKEIARVADKHSKEAVFGGSYGWSSAGRFHHAQSQVHRFLNTAIGGYTKSVNTYSAGASAVIFPHFAGPMDRISRWDGTWSEMADHSELIVAFGGMALRNSQVSAGGISQHVASGSMARAKVRGADFVLVSPLRDDLPGGVEPEWVAVRPNTDVALMLGIAHTLIADGTVDRAFLDRYSTGYDRFEAYVLGKSDGVAKDAAWASRICEIGEDRIVELARRMAAKRTLITMSHSMQRAEHGEQPVWMAMTLAAMLGQVGGTGTGFAYAIGAIGNVGKQMLAVPIPTLPQGSNGAKTYIPVARISDMLLQPGAAFDYDGHRLTYPDIRLIYWAGGNPFHHHQDLDRLRRAFGRPDTVMIHDAFWTASAKHADFVFPATITLERDDLGAAGNDPKLIAMKQVVRPFGQARDDYDIFTDLAERLGRRREFTEDRTAAEWLEHLYEPTRAALAKLGLEAPSLAELWARGEIDLPLDPRPSIMKMFRQDPEKNPLPTPSGKIEIFSETIAAFGYDDCPGHPAWLEPAEWLGGAAAAEHPLQLVANQPSTRLHSQLDFGSNSQAGKRDGREPLRMHPKDAATRKLATGDTVRVFNGRGAFLATLVVSEDVRQGVVQCSTGAWFTPVEEDGTTICVHGNVNTVTRDVGTSRLAQGCTGQLCLVDVVRQVTPVARRDPYAAPKIEELQTA
ncbi:MAG: molybdopterin guanine dinucleotide-containing S/N-oxide reductase [Rhizobiales bacterium]|nr:molybdopterin guanine dinucleotide-containing S/N-oxide reductase [Hyphomicrobiales bacterium]